MNLKLLAVGLGTVLLMAGVLTGVGGTALSAFTGLLLVFVLPGYALTKLLFPGDTLELAETVALALGLSLAASALGGLALYLLPWNLQTRSWTALLGGVTLLATFGAWLRQPHWVASPRPFVKVQVSFSLWHVLLFMLAGAVLTSAFALAYTGELAQSRSDFTQLWIRPENEAASAVQVGINNQGAETVRYRLLLKLDQAVVQEIWPIELKPEETWTHSFILPEDGSDVAAELYRLYAPPQVCSGDNPPDACRQNDDLYREVLLHR